MVRPTVVRAPRGGWSRAVAVGLLAAPYLVTAALEVAWWHHVDVRIVRGDLDAIALRWIEDRRRGRRSTWFAR